MSAISDCHCISNNLAGNCRYQMFIITAAVHATKNTEALYCDIKFTSKPGVSHPSNLIISPKCLKGGWAPDERGHLLGIPRYLNAHMHRHCTGERAHKLITFNKVLLSLNPWAFWYDNSDSTEMEGGDMAERMLGQNGLLKSRSLLYRGYKISMQLVLRGRTQPGLIQRVTSAI